MAELSFGWASNGTGDGAAISVVDSAELLKAIVGGSGVIRGYLNELAPTVSGSNVLVNTGWAVGITGHLYRNSASKSTTITTPGIGTTGHRIVLREDLAAQTVRIYDIASADGTSSIPAAAGTDKTLATLTITTGGVITLTDARQFAVLRSPSSDEMAQLGGGGLLNPSGVTSTGRVMLYNWKATAGGWGYDSTDTTIMGYPQGGLAFYSNTSNVSGFTLQAGRIARINPGGTYTLGLVTAYQTANVSSGVATLVTVVSPNESPWMRIRFNPTSGGDANVTTSVQGFFDTVSATASGAYLRRNTTGNLFFVTRQGGSETTTDLGAQTAAQRWYDIWTPDAGVTWYCRDHTGSQTATHTTNVPTAANKLASGVFVTASGAVAQNHDFSAIAVSYIDS